MGYRTKHLSEIRVSVTLYFTSILTHAIVRKEYLVHCSKERLSKEEKQQLKKLVEEQLLRMQVSDSSDDEPLIKKIESLAGKKKVSDLKKRSRSNSSRDSDERQESPSKQNSKKKRVKSDQSTDEDSGIERKVPIKRRNAKKARKSHSNSESSDLEAEAGSDHEDLTKHDAHNSENKKKSALKSGLTDGKRRMESEHGSSDSEAEARQDKISDVDASDVSSDEEHAVDSKKTVNLESEESDSSAPLKGNFKGGSKSEQKTKAEFNSDSEQSRDSDSEVVQKSASKNAQKAPKNAQKAPKQKSITTKQEKDDSGDGSELVSSSEEDEPASKGTGQDRGKESESSSDEDLLPSAGGKPKQTSKKAKKSSPSNEQESAKEEHPTIKRLKRYIVACGVRRNYKKLFEGRRSNKAKIQALKQELENLGMKGQPSLEKCKALRLKREEAAELASLDVSNIITSGRPRRLNPWTANQKSEEAPPKDNYRKAVDSDSDDEPPAKKRLTAWANLKGIISDDEGSE
ncbi:HIRA-interacting protein 3 isoform X2 [Protopterus annectens]|uniref:HIRA-interacting protein 3 isoform X2 n=1 Tax=Protopterus annectens TaxID=7888 RepID=UPI001CFA67F0|nr:HIRA-interacting protein 3 isoform X2 [Protopterus annectens]